MVCKYRMENALRHGASQLFFAPSRSREQQPAFIQESPADAPIPTIVRTSQELPRAATSVWLLVGSFWALLALAVLVTFWQGPYFFTLASPFRLHLVFALLVVGAPLAVFYPHPRRWVFLALPMAVGVTFLPYLWPHAADAVPDSGKLRVALANIYVGNPNLDRLSAWVQAEQPDLLAIMEVTAEHQAELERLPLAHKTIVARSSAFGIALMSRRPPERVEVLEEDTPFPSLLASWPEYRVLVTHPIPPVSRQAREIGDQQIRRLLASLDDGALPLLVLGDLNAVGWDQRLLPLREAGLVEARKGHGFLPTWPAQLPVFGIPIDHIYLPSDWKSLDCRRGPDIGSDHYPLIADLAPSVSP